MLLYIKILLELRIQVTLYYYLVTYNKLRFNHRKTKLWKYTEISLEVLMKYKNSRSFMLMIYKLLHEKGLVMVVLAEIQSTF